ncbi:MAG: DUF1573 domain-containing protein [Phycisphaerales bacterium]|nr:DUF1573 domain-containing protein [Phycisphaerales bacterium]
MSTTTKRPSTAALRGLVASALVAAPLLLLGSHALAAAQDRTPPTRTPPTRTAPTATPPPSLETIPEGLRPRKPGPMIRTTGGPAIYFPVLDAELGRMTNAETKNYTFKFINTGDQPLTLTEVVPACGCTRPTFDRTRTYQPGEEGEILVAFTPPTGGLQAKSMSVMTNAKIPGELVKIRVIGDVEAVLSFSPQMKDVGEIELGKPFTTNIEITADATDTYFDEVAVRGGGMSAKFTEPAPMKSVAKIEVALPADLPWGRMRSGVLMLKTSGKMEDGRKLTKTLPFRITGVVVDNLRADDYIINLGNPSQGGDFSGKVHVYEKDGKPFEILEPLVKAMSSTSKGVVDAKYDLKIVPSKEEKGGFDVVLSGTVLGEHGFLSGTVDFKTKEADGTVKERSLGINGRVFPADRPGGAAPATRTAPSRPLGPTAPRR